MARSRSRFEWLSPLLQSLLLLMAAVAALSVSRAQTVATRLPGYPNPSADQLSPSAAAAFEANTPIITCVKNKWQSAEDALPFLRRIHANHVWGGTDAEDNARFRNAGIRPVRLISLTWRNITARTPDEWVYVFLKTAWHRKDDAALRMKLLEGFWPGRFKLNPKLDPTMSVRVEKRSSREWISPDRYSVDFSAGTVTLGSDAAAGDYRAVFLAGEQGLNHFKRNRTRRMVDGAVPSVRRRQFNWLRNILVSRPNIEVIRPTSEIFDRVLLFDFTDPEDPDLRLWSRWAYWSGFHPDRLRRYRQRYGREFDPRWILDDCYGEEGFVPTQGYRDWIDLVRDDLHTYVRERNEIVHDAGRRVRLFFGDNFIGLEPWLGDVEACGYDEIVMGMDSGPGSVRFLTGFPADVPRIVRFSWIGKDIAEELVQAPLMWSWMKRELLFKCSEGLTFGGAVTAAAPTEVGDIMADISRDYRQIHDLIHGQPVFTHTGFAVYIANAWGRMRSWVKPTHYLSQNELLPQMVDWPVEIRWLSFDKIIESGVPGDAAALVLMGEPDTAWGGGRYWKHEPLTRAVRDYVRHGGGLLMVGGATWTDGNLALADMLGIEYGGAPSDACAEQLWNLSRWTEAGLHAATYPLGGVCPEAKLQVTPGVMPDDLSRQLDRSTYAVRYDSLIKAAGARPAMRVDAENTGSGRPMRYAAAGAGGVFEKSPTGVFLNRYGSGRTAVIGGYGPYQRLFKTLLFHVAGRLDDLRRLDADSPDVATYWYPKSGLLIVYNHGARPVTTSVRFDPGLAGLGTDGSVKLQPAADDQPALRVRAKTLQAGLPIKLKRGETRYWQVSPAD